MTELSDRIATLSPAKRALLEKLRAAPPIPPVPDGPAPLSAEQRRLWYVLPLAPGYPVYTINLGFRLRGPLDVDALAAALRDLVARHEMLRTAFTERDGEPVQMVHDGASWELRRVEVPEDEWAPSEARFQADDFAQATFDLAAGETFRALLLRLAEDEHHLLLGFHHLAADGWTAGVLVRELAALYGARAAGEEAGLAPPPVRFRDWAAFQQRPREGAEADEAFWRAELDGVPQVLDLPADHPRPAVQGWAGAKHPFTIDAALTDALAAAARAEGTTLYVMLATAYALLLARYAGADDLLVGTLLANRPRPELANVAGFFANTVPLRVRMDGDPTVAELVRRVHAAVAAAQKHGALPFDRIVEIAGVRRDFSRPPLVQAILTFTEDASTLALPGVETERIELDSRTAIFDLTLQVERHGDVLAAALQYPEVFDEGTVRRMARHLTALLRAVARDRARPLSHVSLADEEEIAQAAAWSDGGPARLGEETIPGLFEAQARATPHAVALVHGRDEITYGELNRRANRIAHGLIAAGTRRGESVAVCMGRTPALVASLLGVLKAGAAYVPMDPAHPAPRHHAALGLSGARRVIADAASRGALDGVAGIEIHTVGELDGGRDDDPAPGAEPGDLAYVIFTSGSTGGPKGVAIEHRAAAAMLAWVHDLLEEDRASVLGSTPVTFDVSVAELFGTLSCGGTVVLVENALAPLPPGRTVLAAPMTPTAAAELLRERRLPPGLRSLLLGGEAVPPPLVGALAEAGVQRVVNLWGPTEDTTYSTSAVLEPFTDRVGVGRPVAGGRVYVLDGLLRHAGIGAPGEVWTAGAGVARGYAARPLLTAEKFRPDPHGPPGSRMYRTLDRGRWREDGTLEYLGRLDAQVKVRGHRIELEEVEQALAAHPAVAHAAAAARGDGGGGARTLAAYLVPRPGAAPLPAAELRTFLRERLPEYMVPSAFTWMEALPRTTSGKLDRRALPEPAAGADGAAHVPPAPGMEERLAAVWREVLGVERVGAHDDFFDLGGQSILATRLSARLRTEMGVDVPVAMLVQAPTVQAMARALAAGERAVRLPLVPLQTFGERPPLFMVHPAGGHVICYRTLAVSLAPDQPVYGLQPRGLEDGLEPIDSVPAMAAYYVEAIRRSHPLGPYRLGGWSFGGVVAWEMARQIRAAGEDVDLLAMLDTSPLTDAAIAADPRDPAEVMMQTIAGYAGPMAAERIRVDEVRHLPPREMALAMIRHVGDERLLPDARAELLLALTRVRAANLQAQATYPLQPYGGHLTYFRTEASAEAHLLSPAMEFWSSRAAASTVVPVTGNHGTILHEPHVQFVIRAVLEAGGG